MRYKIKFNRPPLSRTSLSSQSWPVVTRRPAARLNPPVVLPANLAANVLPRSVSQQSALNPYVDYDRQLTAEGGMLMTYTDHDFGWRVFIWCVLMGLEVWFLIRQGFVLETGWDAALLLALAIVNAGIVAIPAQPRHSIEIRPDCMILDGTDVFWLRFMEGGWPTFQEGEAGTRVLRGIYGTRFVEYLTVGRSDDLDNTPEVLAAHLQDAMTQLWSRPF